MKTSILAIATFVIPAVACPTAGAQTSSVRYGERVPQDVKLIYERGLNYLASTQQESGGWAGGQSGSGVTGLCLMAFLACGEDPNFGQYSGNVQRAVRNIIRSQDPRTGYIPQRMYDHGFAMLALAEAYGAVDDAMLWDDGNASGKQRSIGEALELAVRCALTAQRKNSYGGWRYSPDSRDADTSVSGAVLVGLLAARNAGIEVPDEAMEKALQYYKNATSNTGMVAYSGVGGHGASMNRSAIATLVYAIGKRKDWNEFDATLKYITSQLDHQESSYPFYFRYYMAQALFQGDYEAWTRWKQENTLTLRELQQDDGSFTSNHGQAYGTAMALLSLALDFRFLPIYER